MKLLLSCIVFMTILWNGVSAQDATDGVGDALPNFVFQTPAGETLTKESLPANKPVVVVYFDPFCDHCEKQAAMIKSSFSNFKDVTLLWVSWGEAPDIAQFEKDNFGGMSGVKQYFVKDTQYKIDSWFGYSEVPSVYIYDKNWVRVKTLRKESEASIILGALK